MPNFKHIFAVARIEAKLLRRSTTFKILFAVFFLITLFFVVASHIGDIDNIRPSVPGGLALKSFFYFSLIRILISSFLAPVFIKDDRKMDSYKAVSPRPFTNTSYIYGKLIGFTGVMLAMDYFFMLILFVSSLLLPTVANSLWPYLLYPIIITLPLCVFLFGVNVFAAQIFYPLVYFIPLAMVMFFLPLKDVESVQYLDLGAITLPLAYSAITGFYKLGFAVSQRLIYMFAGLGFVWGACLLANLRRRGEKTRSKIKYISRFLFFIFIFVGTAFFVWMNYSVATHKELRGNNAREFRNSNSPLQIESCDLTVIHDDVGLDVQARLKITNPNDFPLERLDLKHHMLFKTHEVVSKKGIKSFRNQFDSISITLNTPLEPNESMELEISDYGSILPTSSYFHISENVVDRVHRSGLTTLGKQTAFLEDDYVLLTPDIDWYPTSYSKYQENEPGYVQRDLTEFSLEVTTHDGLTVISQGKKTDLGDNTYRFEPETPLTQMSLTIGRYQKASIDVDNVEYSYYSVRKNPFGDTEITTKELEKSIQTVKEDIENRLQMKYPFKRYQIVETPIHFFGYNSPLDMSGPYEQPEIRFIPESSIDFDLSVYDGRKRDGVTTLTRGALYKLYRTRTNSRIISNKINLPSSIFSIGGLFQFTTDPFEDTSHILTQYAVFSRGPVSDNDYFNLMAVNWLRSQFGYSEQRGGVVDVFYRSLDSAEIQYFSTKSLKDILSDEKYFYESMDILNMASMSFFNLLAAKSGVNIARLDNAMFYGFARKDIDIAEELTKLCGIDVLELFNDFSEQKEKAHYEITDMTLSTHFIDNRNLHNMRLKVSNPTPYHGLVEFYASGGESSGSEKKVVYFEPFTQKEIGLVSENKHYILYASWLPFGDADVNRYYASNSYNAPVSIRTIDSEQIEFFEGIRDVQLGTVPVAVVMDNLSEGCRIVTSKEKKFIQRYAEKRKKKSTFVKFLNIKGMKNAPDQWTLCKSPMKDSFMNDLYGKFNSCYCTKAGDGDSVVEYTVPIPKQGTYSVYLSVPVRSQYDSYSLSPLLDTGDLGETTVRVFAEDGIHEDVTDISKADGEWALVGTYTFADTTAVIQITDKTNASIVIADAVKLRKAD